MQTFIQWVVFSSILVALAHDAGAEPSLPSQGTVVIAGGSSFTVARQHYAGGSVTTGSFSPSVDYFPLPRLSIGALASVSVLAFDGDAGWFITLGPRVGYALPITDRIVFWPRATVGLMIDVPFGGGGVTVAVGETQHIWTTYFETPVVFDLVPHLFVGVGPSLAYTPAQRGFASVTQVGFASVIGGWF